MVWPYTRGRLFEKKKTEEDRKGEMNMHLNPDELRIAMFQLFLQYMLFQGIQVYCVINLIVKCVKNPVQMIAWMEIAL